MIKVIFKKLLLLMPLLLLVSGTGCGTLKSAYRMSADTVKTVTSMVTPGENPILKKRVLVSPVINQAGISAEKAAQATDILLKSLEKDRSLLVSMSKNSNSSGSRRKSLQFGIVTDPDLVRMAEKQSFNVLITCILNPFEVTPKKTGIWPFRKVKREFKVSMTLNVMDVTNGTLFLTNLESGKIKVEAEDLDEFEKNLNKKEDELDDKSLDKVLRPILKKQSSAVLDALKRQLWTGRISLRANDTIEVQGGKDIGITEGSVFEVFGKGESVRSFDGKEYSLLGPKMGEIKAEKVMEKHSLAVPLGESQIEEGMVIKLKRGR